MDHGIGLPTQTTTPFSEMAIWVFLAGQAAHRGTFLRGLDAFTHNRQSMSCFQALFPYLGRRLPQFCTSWHIPGPQVSAINTQVLNALRPTSYLTVGVSCPWLGWGRILYNRGGDGEVLAEEN